MIEDIYIQKLIDKLSKYELTPLERVILANDATVQSLLSVIFRIPVQVEVIAQVELNRNIYRWVRLVADYSEAGKITTCLAMSIIPTGLNDFQFVEGIRDKQKGIGQLLSELDFKIKREILGFYADETVFSRTYRITGSRITEYNREEKCDILITEVFPRSVFRKVEERRV
jgi:chorismate-pyruvate lyase